MLSRLAAAFIEPFPRLAGNPIPCLRDRVESTYLLDCAVRPLDLHVPKHAVGGPGLPRFENRPTGVGKANVHTLARCSRGPCRGGKRKSPGPERRRQPRTKGGGGIGGIAPSTGPNQ